MAPATSFHFFSRARMLRRACATGALAIGLLLTGGTMAHAAPPANDSFAGRQVLSGTQVTASGTTVDATLEAGEITLYSSYAAGRSVWYEWTAPFSGVATIRVTSVSSTMQWEIGTGTPVGTPSWTYVGSGLGSSTVTVVAGTVYRIGVDMYATTGTAGVPFTIAINPPPENDDFLNAQVVSDPSFTYANNGWGTTEVSEPNHAGIATTRSVWYRYTPTVTGTYWADTLEHVASGGTKLADTVIGVYTGATVSSLTPVASNDDWPSWQRSRVSFTGTAGVTYYVAVASKGGATGDFLFRFGDPPASNDNFAAATVLTGSQFTSTGEANLDTPELGEPTSNYGMTHWYRWTAPSSGALYLRSTRWANAMGFTVYTGASVSTLTQVVSFNTHNCPDLENRVALFNVTAGTTYQIRMNPQSYPNGTRDYTLEGKLGGPPPLNDAFASATALVGDYPSICDQNYFATNEAGEPAHAGVASTGSVWFTWVPSKSGVAHIDLNAPSTYQLDDNVLGVYTGSAVGALSQVAANDDEAAESDFDDADVTFNAVAGTTYRIAVAGKASAYGFFNGDINPVPPNPSPVNDGPTVGTDLDATNSNASYTATWTNTVGYPIRGMDWCLDRVNRSSYSTCSASAVTSGSFALPLPTSHVVSGPFTDGAYFFCVRVFTDFRSASTYRCSDGLTIDSSVAAPAPNDGPSSATDIDWQTSSTSLQATWPAISDISGINRYETCFSSSPTCASGVLQGWTSQGVSTTQTLTGLTLVSGTYYYACVRVFDNAGNQSSSCTDGVRFDNAVSPTSGVGDGAAGDVDVWPSTSDYSINWTSVLDAGSGIARYEYCISTATNCSGTIARTWSNGGTGTNVSATGLSLSLVTYYACVRVVDVAGNVSGAACSDGALVVDPGPDPPTYVNDGAATDIDWSNVTTALQGNWNSATDPQLARHEFCIATAAGCAGTVVTNWTTATLSGGLAMNQGSLALTHGMTYYVAVRGVDTGNNPGGPRTSDGVTIDTIAPPATSPSVTSISSAQPALTWPTVTDALSGTAYYRVYRSTASGTLGAQVNANGATTGGSYTDTGLSAAGTYWYTVRAVDYAGNEQAAGNVQVSTSYVPRMYLRSTASTLATSPGASWQLLTTPGASADTTSKVKIGGGAGYIQYQPGRTATQNKTYVASLPAAPSGRGWIYQTPIGAVPAAEWRFRATVETDIVHEGYLVTRAWKVSTSGGTITAATPLFDWYEESAVNIGASDTTPTTVDFTTPIPPTTFSAGEYLYVEYWTRVPTNPGGNNSSTFVVNTSNEYVEVVGPYVDNAVSATGAVRDGLVSDVDYISASSTTYPVSWNTVTDFSGINRYEYCISSVTACGGAPIRSWTSAGTATSVTATGLTLMPGTTYYACVRVHDNSGNVSVVSCSDGATADGSVPAVASVADGPVLDLTWTTSTTQLQANWPTVVDTGGSGINRYEYCMDDQSPCDTVGVPFVDWTSNGTALLATRASLTLTNGTTYYTCVRAIDNAGNVSTITCSNGQRVDALAPNQPATTNDSLAADIDVQNDGASLSASWSSVTDNGASGVARYEYCLSATTNCGGTPVVNWTSSALATSATAGALTLTDGTTYYACARAVDVAGNVGAMRCSDGVLVDTSVSAPATVYDGAVLLTDAAYTTSSTQLSANWTAVTGDASGVSRYEICLSTATACGGVVLDSWANAGTLTTYTKTGLTLTSGTTYFACVRTVDVATNTSAMRCSNGQFYDGAAPPAPTPINDGSGADIDGQLTASSLSANWAGVVDPAPASGLARYDYCISSVTSCGGTPIVGWTSNGVATSYTVNGLSMQVGVPYYQCVRAIDNAGNVSGVSCSDGVQVTNTTPNAPTTPLQFESDGTTAIATGAWTRSGGTVDLVLRATVSDPDPIQVLTPWVEVIPIASAFAATCGVDVASTWPGATVTTGAAGAATSAEVRVTGLVSGTSYKWRLCVVDQNAAISTWMVRGSSPDFRVDATAPTSPAPVNDGAGADVDAQLSTSTATANWASVTDAHSGFARFDACVSTAPACGGTVALNWTSRGAATTLSQAVTLTSGTTYYVAVRAVDAVGNTIVVSSDGVLVDNGAPPAPSPVRDGAGPGDVDVTSSTTTLQVTWTAVTDPEGSTIQRYDHCVSTLATGADCAGAATAPWLASGTGTSTTRAALTLVSGTTYHQCVRAVDGVGNVGAVACSDGIRVDQGVPLVPTLVSPAVDAVVLLGTDLVASYADAAPVADGLVRFQVCTTSACGVIAATGTSALVTSGSNATWATLGMVPGTEYWWRARAEDEAGNVSAYSAVQRVVIDRAPTAPTLAWPADDAWVTTLEPPLQATFADPDVAATGRLSFELCLANAVDPWATNCSGGYVLGTSPASIAVGASGYWAPNSPLVEGTRYWWRARGTDQWGIDGTFAAARSFRVDATAPSVPTNLRTSAATTTTMTIDWNAATDATSGGITYEVQGSHDGVTWATPCASTATLTCTWTDTFTSARVQFRVRARDAAGNQGAWAHHVTGLGATYYLRTVANSTLLTAAPNKAATTTFTAANTATSTRHGSTQGWYVLQPNVSDVTVTSYTDPASTPPYTPWDPDAAGAVTGSGWVIDEYSGGTVGAGEITARLSFTSNKANGTGNVECRLYRVSTSAGAITASTLVGSDLDTQDVLNAAASTVDCQFPGFATPQTFAVGEALYLEAWLKVSATSGGGPAQNLLLSAEGTASYVRAPLGGSGPAAPLLVSPADAARLSPVALGLTATYQHLTPRDGRVQVQVGADFAFSSIVDDQVGARAGHGTNTTLTAQSLQPASNYYWRARGIDENGLLGPWSGIRVLDTNAPPAAPTAVSPIGASSTTPMLTASAYADPDADAHAATQFQVRTATGSYYNSATEVADSGVLGATTTWTVPTTLTAGNTYHWRVRYRDALGDWSAWSAEAAIAPQAMAVTSASPATQPQGRTATVRVNGVGFAAGAVVTFAGAGVAVTSTTFVDSTAIDVVVDVAGTATLGARDVTVTNPSLQAATATNAFTVTTPAISVSLSTLGYADGARDTTDPHEIGFGTMPAGATLDVGPVGSGQTLAGPAAALQVTNDTDVQVQVAAAAWTGPAALPLATSLLWKHHTVAEAWTGMSTTPATTETGVAPGTATFEYDLRLAMPALQTAGTYNTSVTYTVIPQP